MWIGWNVGIAAKQYTGMLIDHTGMAFSPGEVAVCFLPVTRSTGMAYRLIPSHFEHCISEPLAISGRVFVTFTEYELATGWRFQTVFDAYRESNMAAGKPEML